MKKLGVIVVAAVSIFGMTSVMADMGRKAMGAGADAVGFSGAHGGDARVQPENIYPNRAIFTWRGVAPPPLKVLLTTLSLNNKHTGRHFKNCNVWAQNISSDEWVISSDSLWCANHIKGSTQHSREHTKFILTFKTDPFDTNPIAE